MAQIADRLTEKIQTLTGEQLAEVERFVESLQAWEHTRKLTHLSAPLSEPAFAAIWNNPEDEVYDAL